MGRSREPRSRTSRRGFPVAGRYQVWAGEAELARDRDRADAWVLSVDGVAQSHVDLADATYLAFDYVEHMGGVVDCIRPPGAALDVRHIGGGACTLARYIAATRPGSRQVVFESDGGIAELAREQLGVRAVPRLRLRIVEGRAGVLGCRDDSADLVVVDAFDRAVMPRGLVSAEFVHEVRRTLRTSGTYVLNVADGFALSFARRVTATVQGSFPYVALLAEPGVLRGRRFGNLVVVAAPAPLPVEGIVRRLAGATFPARLVDGRDLWRFCGRAAPVTDADDVQAPKPPRGGYGSPRR